MRAGRPVSPAAGPTHPLAGAFQRSRSERRQTMVAWGQRGVARLRSLGLDVDGCAIDDARLVFTPDGRLALTLDAERIEVALEIAAGQLRPARALLDDPGRALELTSALEALPEQFAIGVLAREGRIAAAHAGTDELRALFDRVERDETDLWLGWTVPREVAVAHASTLDEQLQDAAVALGEVLRLFPSSCGAAAAHAPSRGAAVRRRRRDERSEEERRSPKGRGKSRLRARANDRERDRDADHEAEPDASTDRDASAPKLPRPTGARPRLRAGLRQRPAPAVAAGEQGGSSIDKGTRVRVLEGAFAGKVGLVNDLDGKGGARVMLGLLAVRIDVKDLAPCPEGGGRPRLSSSHRKPLPVRS